MSITRTFAGLANPPLQLAADYLFQRYAGRHEADMAEAIVVVPGSRAGRRLLEILVERAEVESRLLTPPTIETVGRLPETLYRPQRPFATDLVQQLAWARALQATEAERLSAVLRTPPAPTDALRWLDYGRMLARLHTELAADGLDFDDVARRQAELQHAGEQRRWQVLREIQQRYLHLLDELELWDIQTARLVAVDHRECRTASDIVLVGTVDMTLTLRRMLDQVADRVTALVFAPEDWADRFDAYGCLVPAAWEQVEVPVDDDQVHVVENHADQADCAARCLARYAGRYRADEITIGLADESLASSLARQLQECGVTTRSAAGVPLSRTAPYRLLAAIESWLRTEAYPEFAALVRHPDVGDYLARQGLPASWLDQLDGHYNTRLLAALDDADWDRDSEFGAARECYRSIAAWLQPLRDKPRPLGPWAPPLRELLRQIYGYRQWDRDDPADHVVLKTLDAVQKVLVELTQQIPSGLTPVVSAAEALRLTLEQIQTGAVPLAAEPDAVELLGWLELPWDDAPALVVCSLNEGYVPEALTADLFLPDALRSRLGVLDNQRRYARDAYALHVILAARQQVDLIVARRTADGDPLSPSRLLFAADAETVARRVLRFFAAPTPRHALPPLAGGLPAARALPDFPIPRPQSLEQPLAELPVTAFREYLACPYRFYLRRVLKLRTVEDQAEELDGGMFGELLHEVLREFGSGPHRDATDPQEIEAALLGALEGAVAVRFSPRSLATVDVQIEQLRQRLRAFAPCQAAHAGEGWRIEHTEVPRRDQAGATLDVDGWPLTLRGRIDRIDVQRQTGQRWILDYKSSDAARAPDQVHRQRGQWVDLQLPLYRYLAQTLELTGPVQLGYILLPKDLGKVGFHLAEWEDQDLAAADEVAREVVRNIRQQKFWPPTDPPPDFSEDLAPICQDTIFDKTL